MLDISFAYNMVGLLFAIYSLISLVNRNRPIKNRILQFMFWGIYAGTYMLPGKVSDFEMGVAVLCLVFISLSGAFNTGEKVTTEADSFKVNSLGGYVFIPAITVPLIIVIGVIISKELQFIVRGSEALVMLSISTFLVFFISIIVFRDNPIATFSRSEKIMESIGINVLLPQMLAMLGGVVLTFGVGDSVTQLISQHSQNIGKNSIIVIYSVGMLVLSMAMGNAFAAFPIMTAGIGMPFIINNYGGNPAILCVLGMLCGFCGTMLTPIAANFNLLPAMLLSIGRKSLIIKEQLVTAIVVFLFNIMFMIVFIYK